ncbi:hypothetical protein [Mycobacterium sp. E796]|uniref:hypothetical protein n=1 Tax=Mycobacterium sp. E796 TaxID=1834151 RepID=UPI001E4C5537|nr:hypothetical protein [Mycobacterium sp. E796]
MKNVRKTLILAAITGSLVAVPSANAEPMGFDPNVPPVGAPDAPPSRKRPKQVVPGAMARHYLYLY